MIMKNLRSILFLPALAFALTAGQCTDERIVELVIGVPTEIEFLATGSVNTYQDTDTVDVKEDLDLESALDDADIDPEDVDEIQVVQVFYKITVPEAGRTITNGKLEFTRNGAANPGPHLIVNGFSASAAAVTDWIDVTDTLQPGIDQINTFLAECLTELKGGPAVANSSFTYTVSGDSNPAADPTLFQWRVKLVIQVVAERTFEEIPFAN